MATKSTEIRINQGVDKVDNDARVARGLQVASSYPTSAVCAANPTLTAACVDYVAKAKAVGVADAALAAALLVVETCRATRDTASAACDKSHNTLTNQAETYCKTPADVTGIGLVELEPTTHVGQLPIAIVIKQDIANHLLDIHIKYASGTHNVILEMSPDPVTATSYVQQKGHGMKRSIPVPPPGVYWFHAATSLTNGQTAFFGPVSFTVK